MPSVPIASDRVDLGIAARELEVGRELLLNAYEIREPRERREAIKVAIGRLALAARSIDVVVDRRGGVDARR